MNPHALAAIGQKLPLVADKCGAQLLKMRQDPVRTGVPTWLTF